MSLLDQTKAILGDLVGFPSVSSDSNLDIIAYIEARMRAIGARTLVLPNDTGEKANLFASIGPDVPGGLLLSGHTDVVPVEGQDWTTDPFVMREEDGRLYGRGTCDMKGFLAACLAIAPNMAARDLTAPVHFAFTYDEEVGCRGARALVPDLEARGIRPEMALVGEPTLMRVIEGHKGCCEYTARFSGLEGHGSDPYVGVNAAAYAALYVGKLLELRAELDRGVPTDSPFHPRQTTINIGRIESGTAHNVIPGKAEVDWEMRPVRPEDADFVRERITAFVADDLLPAMQQVFPEADIETEIIGEVAGLIPTPANKARDLVMELTGANGADLVPFGTEAGLFQSMGTDTVICGPGSIEQAHKPDEFVTLDQLSACLQLLEGLADRMTRPAT
ncbi:acetylornithine deacetylase [Shimia biformata]|uniref:acetylornithine deacetylase n=1 Tax=Shimia biformata TaxID=1294299 RepID=UPI0019509933|nr:acetylornithine deacetylase [Shimia biformata]